MFAMTNSLFQELLLISLGKRASFSSVPSLEDWQTIFDISKKQALLGICFEGITAAYKSYPGQFSNFPQNLKIQWLGYIAMIQDRNQLMNRKSVELQKSLSLDGFRCCILKGQGVASFYGSLALFRQSGDIDILVDTDKKTLLKYLVDKGIPNNSWDYVHIHPKLFDGIDVELHYRTNVFRNVFRNRNYQKFIESNKDEFFSKNVALDGCGEITIPSDWMNLFYLLHHIYRHMFSEGIGLRQVMDYNFVLKSISLTKDDNVRLLSAVKVFEMERFASGLMWVLGEVFCLEREFMPWDPDEREGRYILEDIMQSGNFGRIDNRYGKFTDSKVRKLITTLRRSAHLCAHYPNEALWTPLYYVWHFCWKKCSH